MKKDFLKNTIIYEDMHRIYVSGTGWKDFRNTKILVTGAYGMVASYLIYFFIYLNEMYDFKIDIWVIVRREEKLRERFGSYVEREYFHCKIQDLNGEIGIEEKMDYIIHAASLASPQYYNLIPTQVMLPNVIGTYFLLEYAKKCNLKKFLFFSSSEIYGKLDEGIQENYDETVLGILDPMDVRNCYSESKRMGENMCMDYYQEHGIKTSSVRIFHTFGPTMDVWHDERAFAEFTANVVEGKNIEMKSAGMAKRSFCYITDAICAFLLILLEKESGQAYNLCNEANFVSIYELAEILVGLFPERKLKVERVKRDESSAYAAKKEENFVTADSGKLRKLGWNPQVTVRDGFERTIRAIEEGM